MQDIQEIFNKVQSKKNELKELRIICKDVLDNSSEYKELIEELRVLRQKKKDLESVLMEDVTNEMTKIEELKLDIKTDQEMIADIALTNVMKGEEVKLTDEYSAVYGPVFNVKFKKLN